MDLRDAARINAKGIDLIENQPAEHKLGRIEKTVFISYRRISFPWAQSIFQDLTQHGYDVFFDFHGIASGGFEEIIFENIRARAHFLVLLTPSALGRCTDPADLFLREIEVAIGSRRNIVPIMLENFDFEAPEIDGQLGDTLIALKQYNGLLVFAAFFSEAMDRLRETYLNVPRDMVLHPISPSADRVAKEQQAAAANAPAITDGRLVNPASEDKHGRAAHRSQPTMEEPWPRVTTTRPANFSSSVPTCQPTCIRTLWPIVRVARIVGWSGPPRRALLCSR